MVDVESVQVFLLVAHGSAFLLLCLSIIVLWRKQQSPLSWDRGNRLGASSFTTPTSFDSPLLSSPSRFSPRSSLGRTSKPSSDDDGPWVRLPWMAQLLMWISGYEWTRRPGYSSWIWAIRNVWIIYIATGISLAVVLFQVVGDGKVPVSVAALDVVALATIATLIPLHWYFVNRIGSVFYLVFPFGGNAAQCQRLRSQFQWLSFLALLIGILTGTVSVTQSPVITRSSLSTVSTVVMGLLACSLMTAFPFACVLLFHLGGVVNTSAAVLRDKLVHVLLESPSRTTGIVRSGSSSSSSVPPVSMSMSMSALPEVVEQFLLLRRSVDCISRGASVLVLPPLAFGILCVMFAAAFWLEVDRNSKQTAEGVLGLALVGVLFFLVGVMSLWRCASYSNTMKQFIEVAALLSMAGSGIDASALMDNDISVSSRNANRSWLSFSLEMMGSNAAVVQDNEDLRRRRRKLATDEQDALLAFLQVARFLDTSFCVFGISVTRSLVLNASGFLLASVYGLAQLLVFGRASKV